MDVTHILGPGYKGTVTFPSGTSVTWPLLSYALYAREFGGKHRQPLLHMHSICTSKYTKCTALWQRPRM